MSYFIAFESPLRFVQTDPSFPVGIVKTPAQFLPVSLISANVDRDEKANRLSPLLWTQMLGFALEVIQFHGQKLSWCG